AQLAEALLDAAFHDVLELDDAEHAGAIGDEQRRTAAARDLLRRRLHALRKRRAERFDVLLNGIRRALAHLAIPDVDAAHARMRGERYEARVQRAQVALAQLEALLREHDDAAPFRCFVGQRGELRGVGQFFFGNAGRWNERGSLAVAERDRAGLVEQQHV